MQKPRRRQALHGRAEGGDDVAQIADELAAMAGRSAINAVRAVQELVTGFSRGELRDDVTLLAVRVGEAP